MKILYLACHAILEFDEIRLFQELGHTVFSLGAYLFPSRPSTTLRPALPLPDPPTDDLEAYQRTLRPGTAPQLCLTRQFVNRFDVVIIMGESDWIQSNWDALSERPVVWRTIGQSNGTVEQAMQLYRDRGVRIVRYSPAERALEHYAGEDALIRFSKFANEWDGWHGSRQAVVNFTQSMPVRKDACQYETFLAVSEGLPVELYGPGNEAAGSLWKGCLSSAELHSVLQSSRAFLFTGTVPASYTLGFIEAWMTGIPVVAFGRSLISQCNPAAAALYEIPDLIENNVSGIVSDDISELRTALQALLSDEEYSRRLSYAGRQAARHFFGQPRALDQWRTFLPTVG